MAKDPAFLYYDADASRDVAHMNRLERGAYLDIIHAQKKFGKLTLPAIKKVLGADFDSVWVAIEMVLTKEDDYFFIDWVRESVEKRKNFAKKQKERIDKYYEKKAVESQKSFHGNTVEEPRLNHGNTMVLPIVNENEIVNENINENEKGVQGEKQKNTQPLPIGFFDISECHQNYFCNSALERTREHLCMTHHVSVEVLRDWGDAFNRRLTEQGELTKTFKDYNTHFGNWLKLQDKTKNPKKLFTDVPEQGASKNGQQPEGNNAAYKRFMAAKLEANRNQG